MCEYCENEKDLIRETELISRQSWGWGDVECSLDGVIEYELSLFIDRGYLRLVDPDDCQCIEGGQKIKVNYCPMCGDKIKEQ